MQRQPLVDIEHTRRERLGLGRAEEMPVVLESRTTARRVDEHRSITRHRGHDLSRQGASAIDQAGVHVEGAAAVAAPLRQSDAHAYSLQDVDHRLVHGPLPSVHHAAGEQPDVGAGRRHPRAPER